MKFLHLGDLHLGKSLGEFDLIDDQKYLLDQILEIGKERKVDGVLLAGDIYDRSVPSEAAVNLFDYFICKLAEQKMHTFVISGNHDSEERLHFGSSLFEANQVYIAAKYEGKLKKCVCQDSYGDVNVYLLPFVKASKVRFYYPEEKIESYDDAVRVLLEKEEIDRSKRNILVAHQFVTGKKEKPRLGGSESLAVQNVGLVEMISLDRFKDFDYVALGHIHSPQQVGREFVRYSGSLMKYSLSEVHSDKSVPLVTLNEKGEIDIELIPLKPLRDMRHIKGKMEQLLKKENIVSSEDFMYVTLTDDSIVDDAMGIFQQVYPNTVKIDYDNSHTRDLEEIDTEELTQEKSFEELIGDFYQLIYGCEISEEEQKLMNEIAREAGVLHETD